MPGILMDYYLVFSTLLVLSVVASQQQQHKCRAYHQYFDIKKSACVKCSVCPRNEVIRQPCGPESDTVCGPFIEFDEFHQAPFINLLPMKNNGTQEVFVSNEVSIDVSRQGGDTAKNDKSPVTRLKSGRWYTLAMALLGVLSLIALFVVIYIVIVCFCRKKKTEKEIIYDPEQCTPMPTPMQIYIPPRDRVKKMPTFQEEEEETDDSSGLSGLSGGRMVVVPNAYLSFAGLHHDAGEYDADNSGQTVSSTSTNYVYFKAPNKGSL